MIPLLIGLTLAPDPLLVAQATPIPAQMLPSPLTQSSGLQDPVASPSPAPTLPAHQLTTQALQLRSDQQTFDQNTEIFEAEGNVEMKFGRSILRADRMQIDLRKRIAIATGNVRVELGNQQVQGNRLEYDFAKEQGVLEKAVGRVDIRNLPSDTASSTGLANDLSRGSVPTPRQPARFVRFQAERISFDAKSWRGEQVRITNDPYNPPELEIRVPTATALLQPNGSTLLSGESGQLVFDQAFFLPLPITLQLSQQSRQAPISIFYDDFDREELRRGVVIQPNFEMVKDPNFKLTLSPQLYPQKLLGSNKGVLDGIGLRTDLQVVYPNQQLTNVLVEFRGFVFEELSDRIRLQVEQVIPTGDGGRVTYSYNYRQRYFNGLLGFQIVQNRLGALYNSPVMRLGDTGIDVSYLLAADQIDAPGQDPPDPNITAATGNIAQRLQLTRLQLGTAFSRTFQIWSPQFLSPFADDLGSSPAGIAGPAPAELRFSAEPIQQGLWLNTGLSSSQSLYSNGRTQSYFAGSVGVDAVLGQFLADSFDYTKVNITYSNGFLTGASPFLFDRIITREQLVLGVLQQIYGPVRLGAQTTLDLQSGQRVDTVFTLGYDRRTYGFAVRYNPVRQTGALELRIDSFNWNESPDPSTEVRSGIERRIR